MTFIHTLSDFDRTSNRVQTVVEPEADGAPLFPDNLIHGGFLRRAQISPAADAVVWEEAGEMARLSYAELRSWAWRIASWVHDQRAPAGSASPTVVAIVLPKGWAQIAAVLGVTWAGAAYVPLDVSWPVARIAEVLGQTGCSLLIGETATRAKLGIGEDLCWFCPDEWLEPGETPESAAARWNGGAPPAGADERSPWLASANDLAYVIYTSGSTGRPKGVMIEHQAACLTLAEVVRRWGVGPGDRVLAVSSLSFDLSVFDIFGVLAAGGTVVLPVESQRRDPSAWLRLSETVTIWNSVPTLLQLALEHLEARGSVTSWPGPLRLVMLSGDWIPVMLPGRLRARADGVSVVSLGGATEAAIWSIAYELDDADPEAMAEWRSVPYGKALAGQTVQVLRGGEDGEHDLTPCAPWVTGRIYIGGGGLARGYWGNPELTRRRFITDHQTGARLYDTGDLGRKWPDGAIELLGRVDRQVKIQGYRVELGEIEATLMRHPSVSAAAVKFFEAASGTMKLVAYVVPSQQTGALDTPALRKFLGEHLPPYMLPLIYALPELPRNANDKVDLAALPTPAPSLYAEAPAAEGPKISALQRAAQQVLNIPAISPDDNLLELGANSADILSIISQVENELSIEIDIEAFFANPTLRGMMESNRPEQNAQTDGLQS
jgi:amino acid adenylation domain-containing protein